MSCKPKIVILVRWPESNRIKNHPEAIQVFEEHYAGSYIISPEIWNQYKDSHYSIPNSEINSRDNKDERAYRDLIECQEICSVCEKTVPTLYLNYCTICDKSICQVCYFVINNSYYCSACKNGIVH